MAPLDAVSDKLKPAVVGFMVAAHGAAAAACGAARRGGRPAAHAAPAAFLQGAATFARLLTRKRDEASTARARLTAGLSKIAAARAQVAELAGALAAEQAVVAARSADTASLIQSIGAERLQADAAAEAGRADEEEAARTQVRRERKGGRGGGRGDRP